MLDRFKLSSHSRFVERRVPHITDYINDRAKLYQPRNMINSALTSRYVEQRTIHSPPLIDMLDIYTQKLRMKLIFGRYVIKAQHLFAHFFRCSSLSFWTRATQFLIFSS